MIFRLKNELFDYMYVKKQMEQRYILQFLYRAGNSNKEIHESLKRIYGKDAYSASAVQYWTQQFKLGRKSVEDEPRSGRPRDDVYRTIIQNEVEEDPYCSIRLIAKKTKIAISTVFQIMTQELGYQYKHLHWIPHNLTFEMKQNRVSQSKQILNSLQTAQRSHFNNILTGDESWFVYINQPKARWVLVDDDPGDVLERSAFQKKKMVTIFVKKNGDFFVELLPDGQNFNSKYFIDVIISKIYELAYPNGWKTKDKKCLLHFDNAPAHKSKISMETLAKYPFKLILNPPYSPDISPLDFSILGTIKARMPYEALETDEALKDAIETILNDLGKEYLKNVYNAWEKRLLDVISKNGEYL